MNIDFAVVCDYAIVDQLGKLSVMGIFQHIWVDKFPAVHPRLHLVLRLRGRRTEIGEHRVAIRLQDDADVEVLKADGLVTFSEPPAGVVEVEAGCILTFDVPLHRAGRYTFDIAVDEETSCQVPIAVAQRPPPATQGAD